MHNVDFTPLIVYIYPTYIGRLTYCLMGKSYVSCFFSHGVVNAVWLWRRTWRNAVMIYVTLL